MSLIAKIRARYAYVICGCCFFFLFANMGMTSTSFNTFQPYIVELPGMNDSLGSVVVSCRTLAAFVASFFAAVYYQRLDCRLGVAIACAATFCAFAIFSLSSGFTGFCIGSVFAGFAYGMGGVVAISLLVGRWFKTGTGTALGIATMGSSVSAMILPPLIIDVIEGVSLHAAFMMLAGIAGLIGIVVTLLLRNWPEGEGPASVAANSAAPAPASAAAANSAVPAAPAAPARRSSWGASSILSSRRYSLMLLVCLILGMCCVGGNSFYAVLLSTNGFSSAFIGIVLSFMGAMAAAGKFAAGRVFDRWGCKDGSAVLFIMISIGYILCCIAVALLKPWLLLIAVCLQYLAVCLDTVGIARWSLELATPDGRARTIRDFQIFCMAGTVLGNLIPGIVMDLAGSYLYSYLFFTVALIAAGIIVYQTYRSLGRANG